MANTTSELIKFAARLQLAIGDESLRGFAPQCDLSDGALRKYLKGETFPTLDRLYAIAKAGKVNEAWLATGAGPMRPGATAPAPLVTPSAPTPDLECMPSDNLGLGESVELLAKIYNSGSKTLIRAIAANLNAFSEAIDNKALAINTLHRMEQMEKRMEKERAAFEQRLQSLEERLKDREAAPEQKVANG